MPNSVITTPSHHFSRLFQLDKIRHPRDFVPMPSEFWQQDNICLEIGAGKGKHALQFASQNPNYQLIAIERTAEKFTAMQKSADQVGLSNLPNLTVIHADAVAWVTHAIPKNSLSKIFILYPNPEPHNPNQRWLNMPFFELLLACLQADGEIILASNIQSYIDEAEQMANEIWQLDVIKSQVPSDSERTHFEVKYLARGEACWQISIKKPHDYVTRFYY
ncbi:MULTISPECIES: tRNA (guanine(46)-N(7))-methyltransferase TrmB [unclassified Moraxella]|uniref:tRNA (guanine(46)-N(7))-methyltransferase TrmB n=1 Tax=unclassified Moraxella TaxID=2685852 RepID=UPI003AF99D70